MTAIIEFDRNVTVDEDDGIARVKITRTGDTSEGVTVFYRENWNSASADQSDLDYYRTTSGVGGHSGSYGSVYFAPGDRTVYVEYRITDDNREEARERLELEIYRVTGDVDLSRFRAAPSARLSHLPFKSDGAFPAEC